MSICTKRKGRPSEQGSQGQGCKRPKKDDQDCPMSELDEQYYHLPGTVVHLAGGGVFHNWPVVCWSRFSFEPKCMWQGLRSTHHMSAGNGWKWKWPNGVEKSEMDLFWCISMTNNVKSCKKINGRVQTFRFSVFTMRGHWLTGALC